MREWGRAGVATHCPCGRTIAIGQPMLTIRITGLSLGRRFRRCVDCAFKDYEDTPPADLPPLPEPVTLGATLKLPTGRGALPFDYKAAQTREPGEDDA